MPRWSTGTRLNTVPGWRQRMRRRRWPALVAQTMQRAGFQLLGRPLVSRTVRMNWHDGSEEVTLYQALFTDTDRIP